MAYWLVIDRNYANDRRGLATYTSACVARLEPYAGSWQGLLFETGEEPKYVVYTYAQGGSALVDIHSARGGHLLCPRQDVHCRLDDGDRIRIGELAC